MQAGEVLITTNVTCRNSVLARRAYALIANETAPPSWERLQERFGEIYPTRMFTWSTALSPGDYRPTRPGQYPDDDSDDESDSEREREWDLGGPELNPQQRVVNMTFELYLDNVAMGRMRNPAFFARVNRSLYSLIATADERATPHVLTCNLTRFKRPAREGNATGVLAEVNCSIASMRAVVMLEELMEESGCMSLYDRSPVALLFITFVSSSESDPAIDRKKRSSHEGIVSVGSSRDNAMSGAICLAKTVSHGYGSLEQFREQ